MVPGTHIKKKSTEGWRASAAMVRLFDLRLPFPSADCDYRLAHIGTHVGTGSWDFNTSWTFVFASPTRYGG